MQVLEAQFWILQSASVHLQAPEDVREPVPQSLKLCDRGEELKAPPVVNGGQCSTSMAATFLAAETLGSDHNMCITASGNEGCLVLHLGLAQRSSGGSSQAVGALLLFMLLSQM